MRCMKCNKVVGPHDIKEGFCEECYSPENVKKKMEGEFKTYDNDMIELVNKNTNETKRIKYGYDLEFVSRGIYAPLQENDIKGFLMLAGSFALVAGGSYFIVKNAHLPSWILIGVIVVFFIVAGSVYAKRRIKHLLDIGFEPADKHSEEVLKKLDLIDTKRK